MQILEEVGLLVTERFGVAGLAVGVVQGEQVYARGFGVKNIESREPVTERSLFHLASISKTFVATAVMQLAEQGKLEFDAPLHVYLSDFRLDDERFRDITLRQMLNHTSGMPDTDDYGWDNPDYDDLALERYMHSLASEKLIGPPGEKFAYSNIAYEVLGLLIARTAGQSFESYIKEHLLRPLDMNSSTFLKTEVDPAHATTPHLLLPPTVVSPEYPYNRAHAPSSTLHSSALELCSWALVNLRRGNLKDQRILQPASYEQLWHPYKETGPSHPDEFAGLSWFLDTYRGRRRIRHDGEDVGFQSDMILLPDQSLAVVVLANTIPAPVARVAETILDHLLGLEPELLKPPVLMALEEALSIEGIQGAADRYHQLLKTEEDRYDFGPRPFLDVAYTLLDIRRYTRSLQMAQLGLELFPGSSAFAELLEEITSKGGSASPSMTSSR
jgi:CubicO group peptidase (beta-lactamase class C family)